MKKIILIFALCFVVFLQGDNINEFEAQEFEVQEQNASSDDSGKKIYLLVQDFVKLNQKLKKAKETQDINSSSFKSLNSEISREKAKILATIPGVITQQKINSDDVNKFLEVRQNLESLKERSTKNHFVFVDTSLDLMYMQVIQDFFSALFKLEKLFKETASSSSMIAVIDESLNALQKDSVNNLGENKAKITNESELLRVERKEAMIANAVEAYNEILMHLKDNANLLESNYIFSTFKFQDWINYINEIFDIEYINVGKVLLCVIVILFFISLRKFLANILYIVLIKLFYRNKDGSSVKELFIDSIKKPVGYLLLVYAISLCLTIIFYPQPVFLAITNLLYIIYAIFFALLAFKIIDGYGMVIISKIAQKSGKKEVINLVIKIVYFIIFIIAILFILSRLGFNISAIIASLGIGGLAVALAAKDIIANFFASILLLFDDSFNQGDWVEIAGIEGNVVETGLRKTTIRTFDNSLVFLPNSAVMAANIKNWSKRRIGRHIKMYIGVGYDATPEKLDACVNDLRELLNTSELVSHPEDNALKAGSWAKYRQNLVSINDLEGYKNACYVALSDFGDSSINIELYFYTKGVTAKDFRETRHKLMLEFMRIVAKNGLSFAFPSRSIYIENLPKNLEFSTKA
ncbi:MULTISPECIES: mechanosensitive ion channel domain-containing protein [unclassified Campylobacter]|uniref:mechanosensitive ion channel domain-containing protein n=1 Tax=unclassified Campylobacter TaxID=2593542 RepID=UPI001238364F|nr:MULTISPECIES: mechanosensitive ion channel domain-containing protein [unclassified Campylobacter]KAA6225071.1 mechanosensitive ion channel [Campylobacter sp. LR196d]KAA6226084.1 mechanosensitive ion channel [Campylobacter sp. LR185c]KAA6228030.1 mechanosensitive ion channel [Campylobacter sp. LR286c]KAA6231285.1 mechanosensitive ion channel [Campylobacter sp. LR264d]KAA6231496.1 mechanosensitive ion channel [Campylobacter sp. LR291e]